MIVGSRLNIVLSIMIEGIYNFFII